MRTALLYTMLLSAAMTAPALAGPEFFIEDFVGTILVETTTDPNIRVSREDNMSGVNLYTDGGNLKIDGGLISPMEMVVKAITGLSQLACLKNKMTARLAVTKI